DTGLGHFSHIVPGRSADTGLGHFSHIDPEHSADTGLGHFSHIVPGRSADTGLGHFSHIVPEHSTDTGLGHFSHIGSECSTDSSVADCSLPLSVSEDELRTELSLLGFPAVPRHRLLQFKEELEHLMRSQPASETNSGATAQSEKENIPSPLLVEASSNHEVFLVPLDYSKHTVSLGAPGQEKKRAITRKVLRKKSNGQLEVCDESTLSSEENLSITDKSVEGESRMSSRQSHTSSVDCVKSFIRVPPYSLLEQYRQHSDPVGRYHEYKHSWDAVQRVLERNRKELRWGVRERMMSAPPAPLPRSLPAPNAYIIPTNKKRYDLRWAIRQDLATGNIPRGSSSS
ncbi:centriolar and ciliogenesis-associated protein HYLS1, partial [Pyxicephalus adspersus]|uniref:centriolar and ciliogenesis-associated protein HYLS1 n=1 Tax=Pyxicephalus adspersus TaxID=30357 RepID=UPI003B597C0A